ncbi:TrmB family transcriptional regulator [Anaerosacchariphilus polymeriproducens]|uniref:TrmB family transcriptional regulator n=1 Tax=Anaerosacchariphilus polymeriproducens TaxID=1812858 RepID=A0A371ATH7_9FIRM|nr:TrmB family transcriptional regulator [Anaerosacchariphilus polymeriproducens]RDU22885.1 TrmB family transcriptional regulator [Anaerosacchariphilus polymeriproducens]
MDYQILSDKLMNFGMTRQETTVYFCLLNNTQMTGYEVAKQTGISRSNAYNTLAGLVEKGAAYIIESNSTTKYIAVEIEEYCNNKIRSLNEMKQYLVKNIPRRKEENEGYITITGKQNIYDKIRNMLEGAKKRVYISMPGFQLDLFHEQLKSLIQTGIKVVVISEEKWDMQGAFIYLNENLDNQIRVITDSKYVLIGEVEDNDGTCLYSGQKNFVRVFKDYLRNEITLIQYKEENLRK